MKTALIAFVCLVAITGAILFFLRRQPTRHGKAEARALLLAHLAEGRDYRVYVGIPPDSPVEWTEAQVVGQRLSLAGESLNIEHITAFLVVYPNGEVLSSEQVFFPLPDGVRFVESVARSRHDTLDTAELIEGQALVQISYGTSASRPTERWHYSTTIQNNSDSKIRVLKFAGFERSGGEYSLNTINGDFFTADEFISWYGAPEDGWIAPGASATDANNYGGGDGYWVYYFVTENGKEFAAGARIPR